MFFKRNTAFVISATVITCALSAPLWAVGEEGSDDREGASTAPVLHVNQPVPQQRIDTSFSAVQRNPSANQFENIFTPPVPKLTINGQSAPYEYRYGSVSGELWLMQRGIRLAVFKSKS